MNYSLIMSLQTAATDVDLWTPINNANKIISPVTSSIEW